MEELVVATEFCYRMRVKPPRVVTGLGGITEIPLYPMAKVLYGKQGNLPLLP